MGGPMPTISNPVRFGPFELDASSGELRKNGMRIRLADQPLQILTLLLEHPGQVVTREELRQRLWSSDTFVDFEHSLNAAVKRLRESLGDSAEGSRFIETLPRHGYRFVAAAGGMELSDPPAETSSAKNRPWKTYSLVASAFLVLALVTAAYFFRDRPTLTERDTVVLADFANSTGDAVFDDTLKTGLGVSLRQSPFLNVLSDSKVAATLQLMTRPASTRLRPEVARELCLRAGSKAYLAGSIDSLGSEYVLGLKAVNCQNGDTLAQEQVTAAAKERVLDALGKTASPVLLVKSARTMVSLIASRAC
jgi:DNA-binding winged helix-turn-helix (wHTH) protein